MLQIQNNIELKPLTTFKIGGPADYFISVTNQAELAEAITWAQEKKQPVFFFGGGSNVLIHDNGFRGVVIHITADDLKVSETEINCAVGTKLLTLVTTAAEHGLSGLQNLTGIPGTVGGAIRGNAGAFGVEIKDVIKEVTAFHRETGEVRVFSTAECAFEYRQSFFKSHPEWIVWSGRFELTPGDVKTITVEGAEILAQRNRKQIQDIKSAGSCFVNPVVDEKLREQFETEKGVQSHGGRVPAGWLIDKAGLRGTKVGDAMSSEMHPNYILNAGNATSADVISLIQQIKQTVKEKFGIELHEEIQYLGFA